MMSWTQRQVSPKSFPLQQEICKGSMAAGPSINISKNERGIELNEDNFFI
jgi:hypothetical protein